jgi:multicomponent Na+:H+ antiporter subunit B
MTSGQKKFVLAFQTILILCAVVLVLVPVFLSTHPWPTLARDFLENNGFNNTGAQNQVSAIYLGYRAYDTLGETIVLLLAVSGTIGIISKSGISLARGYGETMLEFSESKSTLLRTDLIDVVTGKLGPIVLLFGLYVMLFGHISPGGGFQGGVVIASGIVFMALGSKSGASTRLEEAKVLAKIESVCFLLLILTSLAGIPMGMGYFSNPMRVDPSFQVIYIIILNSIIGLKVGAGIGYMCVAMLGKG